MGIAKALVPQCSRLLEEKAPILFRISYIQSYFLLATGFEDSGRSLMASHRNVNNPNKRKGAFPASAFHRTALLYIRAWHIHFSLPTDASPDKLGTDGFRDFLAVKLPHKKATMTNFLYIFTNVRKLFQDDVGAKVLGAAKHPQSNARYLLDSEQNLSKRPWQCYLKCSFSTSLLSRCKWSC